MKRINYKCDFCEKEINLEVGANFIYPAILNTIYILEGCDDCRKNAENYLLERKKNKYDVKKTQVNQIAANLSSKSGLPYCRTCYDNIQKGELSAIHHKDGSHSIGNNHVPCSCSICLPSDKTCFYGEDHKCGKDKLCNMQ